MIDLEDKFDKRNLKQFSTPAQGFEQIDALKDKLSQVMTQNQDLKKDLLSAQRIQIEQSKALERITNENEYPSRMKALIEELRVSKDLNIKLKDQYRNLDKNSKMSQEHMIRLESTIRELR